MFLEKEKLVVADQCRGVLGVGVGGIYVGEWWGVLGKKIILLQNLQIRRRRTDSLLAHLLRRELAADEQVTT